MTNATNECRHSTKLTGKCVKCGEYPYLVTGEGKAPREYYECGICNCLHPWSFDGDCRDDNNRFTYDQVDEMNDIVRSWDDRIDADLKG